MEIPENMTITPHPYQLKGAGQADWACRGPFKGLLLGDGMGMGKTITAILAMYQQRTEPGLCVVIVPASLCLQWVEIINGLWQQVSRNLLST
jgi:SNF2 family DNA or RNA helicase